MQRNAIYLPLIFGTLLGAGIWIGSHFNSNSSTGSRYNGYDKIDAVLGIVEKTYVDTVDHEALVEETIADMLQSLDPHSDYFSAEDARAMDEPLQGNFQGIGIEYNLIRDTVAVLAVIHGGPSENILRPGDRLIKADNQSLIGKLEEKDIKGKLRGPAGTKVSILIRRPGEAKPLTVAVTRGSVPIYSIDVAYMLDATTGYIKLSRFASTSHDEFVDKMNILRKQGMKKLVLDLRGNGGGYLETAVDLADEFLKQGQKIVYTEGRASKRKDYDASNAGSEELTPLALLIDEYSASASEIIAGAIQDNDRGTLIGRRSFGKGLVQHEEVLSDSSAFRITIARYYTPTGRCIQKPYDKGLENYRAEENNRYRNGELFHADSIHFSTKQKYYTLNKRRLVYGGGAIMPDVFVPLDTAGLTTTLYRDLYSKNVVSLYAFDYVDKNRKALKEAGLKKFLDTFTISDKDYDAFIAFAVAQGVRSTPAQAALSGPAIRLALKAAIARVIWNDDGYYPVINSRDETISKAIEALNK